MKFDPNNNQEHAMYSHAIKSLEKARTVAEHHKVAEHPQELDFMQAVNQDTTRVVSQIPYKEGQFEAIFHR